MYRLHGEHDVWTHFLTQSIEAQRTVRQWTAEDEGRILYFLRSTLLSQKCYTSMLHENLGGARHQWQCELVPLDMSKLTAQYNVILVQAYIVDEALQTIKDDSAQLVKAIGILAFVWAHWNLEAEDKFRQNEVLLVMSTLIYNTVHSIEKGKRNQPEVLLTPFQSAFEYFTLLLISVEWPKSWKEPLRAKINTLFPQIRAGGREGAVQKEQKDAVLEHPLTQAYLRLESYETSRPEPGQDFFSRHRALYSWVMKSDESIAFEYVQSQAPGLLNSDQRPPGP